MHSAKTSQIVDEDEKLLEVIQKTFTKQLLFDLLFTDNQVYECLEQRKSLRNFLNLLSTSDLREALIRKQREGDLAAYQRRQQDKNKINVKDLTINQLVQRNWALRLIPYDRYSSHKSIRGKKYMLRDHYELGTNLVEADPNTYQIGKRSGHFNHAQEIQRQYKQQRPPQGSDASESEFKDSQEEQRNDGEGGGGQREYDGDLDEDEDEDDDFIDDRKSEQLIYEAKNSKKKRKIQKMNHKRPKLKKIQDSDDQEFIEELIHDHESEQQDQDQIISNNKESSPIIEQPRTRNLRSSQIPKQNLLTNYLAKKTQQQARPKRLKRVLDSD